MPKLTPAVEKILNYYTYENEALLQNIARLFMQGRLGGTGRMVILPVDQGWEHGPARSYAPNPVAYNPDYFVKLAVDAGLNAYAGPLGQLAAVTKEYRNKLPLILKINSATTLVGAKNNAITATVDDAVRLGCAAVGYTVYPGSDDYYTQVEKLVDISAQARKKDLPMIVWSYPRGGTLSKDGETALDIVAYGAHMAAQCGAHIVKVKLPTAHIKQDAAKKAYENVAKDTLADRVRHVVQSCFDGRRPVVFSGGEAKDTDSVLNDARAIHAGGGNGSIIGRNAFQRPEADALKLLDEIVKIYSA
ncbi:MAG: class I fructose-bisphosphate aldolase [Bdellovibrionales bacterium]